jgi:hypothetical protein
MCSEKPFVLDRCFIITRNFLDVLPSFFLRQNTATHSAFSERPLNEAFPEAFDSWIRYSVQMFKEFHHFFMHKLHGKVPVYFLRYEDQTTCSKEMNTELFRFMFDTPCIEGTVLQHRINEVTSKKTTTRSIYRMKTDNVTHNRSAHLYTPEQLEFIKTELREYNHFFGYVKNAADPENNTAFFDYTDNEADLAIYNGFRKRNAEELSKLGQGEPKSYQKDHHDDLVSKIERLWVAHQLKPMRREGEVA